MKGDKAVGFVAQGDDVVWPENEPIKFEEYLKTIWSGVIGTQDVAHDQQFEEGHEIDYIYRIYGSTFVWNQLFENSSSSVITRSGDVYLQQIDGVRSVFTSTGQTVNATTNTDMLIDLTWLFGLYTYFYPLGITQEQFEQYFPLDYYDYDPGRILRNCAETYTIECKDSDNNIVTRSFNLNIKTLTGKLNGSGDSVTIFPNGMNATLYADCIYKDTADGLWKALLRNRDTTVNLSTATWTALGNYRYYTVVSSSATNNLYSTGGSTSKWCISDKHTSYTYDSMNSAAGNVLGRCSMYRTSNSTRFVISKAEKDAGNLPTSARIIYPLATTKTYVLDNQNLLEQQIGVFYKNSTESITPTNGTSPTTGVFGSGFRFTIIDYEVKRICVENWGGNIIPGEITKWEAAQVQTVGNKFYNNQLIERFDEFKYFVGLTQSHSQNVNSYSAGTFYNCDKLIKLTMPAANLSTLPGFVRDAGALTEIDLSPITSSTVTMSTSFRDTPKLVKVTYPHNKEIIGNTYYTFRQSSTTNELTTIDFNGCDLSGINSYAGNMFNNCAHLTTLIGPVTGILLNLDISDAPLTRDSVLVLINGLEEVSTTKTLTIKASSYNLLTEDDIAIATNKGWTIASA